MPSRCVSTSRCSASLSFSHSSIHHSNHLTHWHPLSHTQSAELHHPNAQDLASPRLCSALEDPYARILPSPRKSHHPGPGSFPADATHRPGWPCSPPLGLNRLVRCQKTCCGHNEFMFLLAVHSPLSRLGNPMGFL
ncbi:hypothetical protein BDP81DRAFT_79455 [Colletotrichum phormii]|uniref:Uncharacterized protein n=1 Tax=Colletotrichum phormii TaxID=359342 RepID=A0AAJ0A407_9PEZI|nr:uncharacterized protein BDP81DRAFT_79455 [Colletotrichum phormii]KAK1654205.1 hypothetical protein BDP81DRAFT_79455 [Colletotrichum phormii]